MQYYSLFMEGPGLLQCASPILLDRTRRQVGLLAGKGTTMNAQRMTGNGTVRDVERVDRVDIQRRPCAVHLGRRSGFGERRLTIFAQWVREMRAAGNGLGTSERERCASVRTAAAALFVFLAMASGSKSLIVSNFSETLISASGSSDSLLGSSSSRGLPCRPCET